MDFLKDVIKESGNEYAALVSDGIEAGDVNEFVDTGSYIFNALLSGSVYGGLPANKITAVAGESSTGKCARGSESIKVYVSEETKKRLNL